MWIFSQNEWEQPIAINTTQIKTIYVQDTIFVDENGSDSRGYVICAEVPMLNDKGKMEVQVLEITDVETMKSRACLLFDTEDGATAYLFDLVKKMNGEES